MPVDPDTPHYSNPSWDEVIAEFTRGGYGGDLQLTGAWVDAMDLPNNGEVPQNLQQAPQVRAALDTTMEPAVPPFPSIGVEHYSNPSSTDEVIRSAEFGRGGYGDDLGSMGASVPAQIDDRPIGFNWQVDATNLPNNGEFQMSQQAPQVGAMLDPAMEPTMPLLPLIRVDAAWDTHFMEHLESLDAPNLLNFFMDLGNITWSHVFTQPVARRPTQDVCEKIITETCQRQLSVNPEWTGLEEGTSIVYYLIGKCINCHVNFASTIHRGETPTRRAPKHICGSNSLVHIF